MTNKEKNEIILGMSNIEISNEKDFRELKLFLKKMERFDKQLKEIIDTAKRKVIKYETIKELEKFNKELKEEIEKINEGLKEIDEKLGKFDLEEDFDFLDFN